MVISLAIASCGAPKLVTAVNQRWGTCSRTRSRSVDHHQHGALFAAPALDQRDEIAQRPGINGVEGFTEHTIRTMTDDFANGDIEQAMSTYANPASVVAAPGQVITGDLAMRAMFADFIATGVNFTYGDHEEVVSGSTRCTSWHGRRPAQTALWLGHSIANRHSRCHCRQRAPWLYWSASLTAPGKW